MPLFDQALIGATGPQGPQGATGPSGGGASTGIAYGGDIASGIAGPVIISIEGYSAPGITGGVLNMNVQQSINMAIVRGRAIDQVAELRTVGTAYNNLFVFSLDDSISGATGTFQNVVAKVVAVSSPTAIYNGRWTIEQDYRMFNSVSNSFPTGSSLTVSGPLAPDANTPLWTATMSASGPTGFVMVRGHSGVQWVGVMQRIRSAG